MLDSSNLTVISSGRSELEEAVVILTISLSLSLERSSGKGTTVMNNVRGDHKCLVVTSLLEMPLQI